MSGEVAVPDVGARDGAGHRAPEQDPPFDGHWQLAVMAAGVLLVSIGYAMGRADAHDATLVYWIGELAIFGAALAVSLDARLNARAASFMTVGFAIATALSKWMYSPLRLKFPDELQHLLGTINVISHDGYGYSNRTLPISTGYPALETIGAVVHRMTGLSLDGTGLLLGCVFHLAAVCLVGALLRRMTGSLRSGTIAVVAYGCNASFGFFNSMYIYENVALVFALLAVLCAQLAARSASRAVLVRRGVIAVLATIATLVSHHVTMLGLCVALIVLAFLVFRRRSTGVDSVGGRRFVYGLTGGAILVTLVWFSAVARDTWSYIAPYTVGFTGQSTPTVVPRHGTGLHLQLPANAPETEVVIAAGGLLLLFLVCLVGLALELKRRRRIGLTYLVAAAVLGALEVGRLVSGKGSEVAGRSAVFLYLPVAAAVGLTVPMLVSELGRRRRQRGRRAATSVVLAISFAGGILIAWPAWWDRIPGGPLIATQFERGNDSAENAAASWARTAIPANEPITGDSGGLAVLTTRAGLVGVSNLAPVFYAPRLDRGLRAQLDERGVRWAWVNTKLPHVYSVDGSYYGSQSTYTTAPTVRGLTKFDRTPGVFRVYDNGEIRIYNLIGFEGS